MMKFDYFTSNVNSSDKLIHLIVQSRIYIMCYAILVLHIKSIFSEMKKKQELMLFFEQSHKLTKMRLRIFSSTQCLYFTGY